MISSPIRVSLWMALLCGASCFSMIRSTYRTSTILQGSASSRDRMLSRTLEKMEQKRVPSAESLPPLEEEPLLPMVEVAAKASDDRKAGNIFGFRLSHLSEIATFMLLVEGNSRPQIQAIANSIEDEVLLEFKESPIKQGSATSGWIILDYGSIIVHVMTPQMRSFYKLERRWKDAEVVDLSHILSPQRENTEEMELPLVQDSEDPFWA